jgi:hypothetical protein
MTNAVITTVVIVVNALAAADRPARAAAAADPLEVLRQT